MLVAAFAMLVVSSPAPKVPAASPTVHGPPVRPAPSAAMHPGDLYSARAKRRIASYLRMRILELRLRSLDRAAEVVEHHLSLDDLLRIPSP